MIFVILKLNNGEPSWRCDCVHVPEVTAGGSGTDEAAATTWEIRKISAPITETKRLSEEDDPRPTNQREKEGSSLHLCSGTDERSSLWSARGAGLPVSVLAEDFCRRSSTFNGHIPLFLFLLTVLLRNQFSFIILLFLIFFFSC